MKKIFFTTTLLALTLILSSCGVNDSYDYTAPSSPTGVGVINGDNRVEVYWNPNHESDVAGYNVYYSYSYDGKYTLIGSTKNDYFFDDGAVNGDTYYYAVTAFDYNGNESDLSRDDVSSTPRPQGSYVIRDYTLYPNLGGFSFFDYSVVPYNSDSTDFFFEYYQGTYYLDVWEDTDIQDMGPTYDIYDIPYAPTSGWIDLVPGENIKYAEAIPGHTYVIWTYDNHYAKVRINNISADRLDFDWAFQLVQGNKQLKTTVKDRSQRGIRQKTLVR